MQIDDRGETHGRSYFENALHTMNIIEAMQRGPNWDHLDKDMQHALLMIATKIGRILSGRPYYDDHWKDIAGYASLVHDRLTYKPE